QGVIPLGRRGPFISSPILCLSLLEIQLASTPFLPYDGCRPIYPQRIPTMNRRHFLETSAAGLALAATGTSGQQQEQPRPQRVGLIGCGWYGKSDLLRLIQVAPVEVVSLCDVDRNMLSDAAQIVSTRQRNRQRPTTYSDYREMLRQRNLDIVLIATPD